MKTSIETQEGRCATHGKVEGTREIPRMSFPFIYYAYVRSRARKREPFLCPVCDEPVEVA